MADTMTGPSDRRYTSGQYMGFFMLMFMPFGIVLWLLLDNPGMIGVGVALGISIGASFDHQRRGDRSRGGRTFNVVVFGIAFALVLLGGIFILLILMI